MIVGANRDVFLQKRFAYSPLEGSRITLYVRRVTKNNEQGRATLVGGVQKKYDASAKAMLKETVERRRGYWHSGHQGLLDFSPSYLQAYLDFHEPPFTADRLGTKLCEFI